MTDIEQRLIEAARNGEWLNCAEPDTVVRAGLIRELLLGRHGELDPRGVRLGGAKLQGVLNLERLDAAVGLFLTDCTIDEQIRARLARLPDLMIFGGRCAGLDADGLHVDGDLFLRDGARVVSDFPGGAIRLLGAHVEGDFDLTDTEIVNTAGPALNAAGLIVNGFMYLRKGVRITGHGSEGAVNLIGARLASNLELTDTEITNANGPALHAGGISVKGGMYLRRRNRLTGHVGISGAIDLVGGHVGKNLELSEAEVTNTAGPAVRAYRIHIEGALFLFGRTVLIGGGDSPALNLSAARIADRFQSMSAVRLEVQNASSPVLDLQGATVGASVTLPAALTCPGGGRGRHCSHHSQVQVDDLTYTALSPGQDWQQWLHLIRRHTPAYHASAYQRLAAVERAAGHDGTVRRILMAQQTDLRRRSPKALGGFMTRRFHWMWGVLAGYGYRARRTAAALLLVLTVAGALGWWAGQIPTRTGHLVAERVTTATAATGTPCSTVELIGLGLDRGLPLAMTGMRARCDLDTASGAGQTFTAAIWLVQLAVWGLATLALAGYTNLVRKPG